MTISRAEVLRRAMLWPAGTVPYEQGEIWDDGYRQDCSGYVSMCWAIPPAENHGWGGQSTVSLVSAGYMTEIGVNDLQPGDAIGICGPSTGGDFGHVVLFRGWLNNDPSDDRYYCSEQMGGRAGPYHSVRRYPYDGMGGNWRAWRFRSISEDDSTGGSDVSDLWEAVNASRGRNTVGNAVFEAAYGAADALKAIGQFAADEKARDGVEAAKLEKLDAAIAALASALQQPTGAPSVDDLRDALPTATDIAKALIAELAR